MPLIGVEAAAATAVAWLASIIVFSYFVDRCGLALVPSVALGFALLIAAVVWPALRRRTSRDVASLRASRPSPSSPSAG